MRTEIILITKNPQPAPQKYCNGLKAIWKFIKKGEIYEFYEIYESFIKFVSMDENHGIFGGFSGAFCFPENNILIKNYRNYEKRGLYRNFFI